MIIKVTLNDNDFTQFIESYFKRFAFDNYYYYINKVYKNDTQKWVSLHIDMENKMQKAFYKQNEMDKNDYTIFKQYIRQGLAAYIYDNISSITNYSEKSIYNDLQIDFVDAIYDKDILNGNGEVVFYILQQHKYVTY